jgi:hypothetical protein
MQAQLGAGATLDPKGREALATVTRKRGSIQLVRMEDEGQANLMLSAARRAWQREGYKVLLAADWKARAESFEEQTGIHSITFRGLIRGLDTNRGLLRGLDSAHRKAASLVLGFKKSSQFVNYWLKASGRWLHFDSKSVLVLALPSKLALPDMAKLITRAEKHRGKVVLLDLSKPISREREGAAETLVRLRSLFERREQRRQWDEERRA